MAPSDSEDEDEDEDDDSGSSGDEGEHKEQVASREVAVAWQERERLGAGASSRMQHLDAQTKQMHDAVAGLLSDSVDVKGQVGKGGESKCIEEVLKIQGSRIASFVKCHSSLAPASAPRSNQAPAISGDDRHSMSRGVNADEDELFNLGCNHAANEMWTSMNEPRCEYPLHLNNDDHRDSREWLLQAYCGGGGGGGSCSGGDGGGQEQDVGSGRDVCMEVKLEEDSCMGAGGAGQEGVGSDQGGGRAEDKGDTQAQGPNEPLGPSAVTTMDKSMSA